MLIDWRVAALEISIRRVTGKLPPSPVGATAIVAVAGKSVSQLIRRPQPWSSSVGVDR